MKPSSFRPTNGFLTTQSSRAPPLDESLALQQQDGFGVPLTHDTMPNKGMPQPPSQTTFIEDYDSPMNVDRLGGPADSEVGSTHCPPMVTSDKQPVENFYVSCTSELPLNNTMAV